MNDHKKFKRRSPHAASIDGIVSANPQLGSPARHSYQPTRGQPAPSLDSVMHRHDGFHPVRSGQSALGRSAETAEAEALLNEPIVLDNDSIAADKKRRHLGTRRSRLKRGLKRFSLVLAALILVGGGYFGFKFYLAQKNLFRGGGGAPALAENIDISQLKGEGDGRINVLLLGIGGSKHTGGNLTDTILIASIDPINHRTALLSIPRDLWVKIPGYGYSKINAAYAYGKENLRSKNSKDKEKAGISLIDQTLKPVIGIPIHYHVLVDFDAFKQTVDAVGGVTFYVPETLYDPTIAWENRYNPVIAQKGTQSFNGSRALLYVKSRQTSSDFARGQRQRQVLVALKDKVLSAGTYTNPVKISQLLNSLGNNIYTDFTLNDIMRLQQIMKKNPSADISSLDLVTPPHNFLTTANMNGLSIVQPKSGLFDYTQVKNYVRNALRDGFLAKENATVAVYNATTTTGLAATKASELKSFGYNVTTIESATNLTDPAKTTVVDLSKGTKKYTRHYLEERFGVTAKNSLPTSFGITPPAGTHFVIILGNDVGPTR